MHDALEERRVARESGGQVVERVERVLAEAGEPRPEIRERSASAASAVRAEVQATREQVVCSQSSEECVTEYTEGHTSGSPSPCRH